MRNRTQKIDLLKQILEGKMNISNLMERKTFEVWLSTDNDIETSKAMFENENGIKLMKEDIEINSLIGKGAKNNIYILGMNRDIPLSSNENEVKM